MTECVITFRTPRRVQDRNGQWITDGTEDREVLARVDSVGRSEFFAAGQSGFRPEYRFTLFHDEYRGEDECVFMGEAYAIYRTYHVPGTDDLELYVQKKVGVHYGA